MLVYGEKSYAWEKGRQLSEITDGESTYSYTYDENGIRNSKTVNGETTYINSLNGTVLSQKCGENTMYFQYRNGVPVGFVYNGTQYLYITNQQNDVIAITDAGGGTMAAYYYDEWGKLLGIETAADSEEQMEIAQANPIRYRGYYYDNETGYYYLQSRYYDPSICRFINADSFSYINNYSEFSKNAYAYCKNNPIMYVDYDGRKGNPQGEAVAAIISEIFRQYDNWFAEMLNSIPPLGQSVVNIIDAIFICLDAQKLSDDFAYVMGAIFSTGIGKLEEISRSWYNDLREDFQDFMQSITYKLLKALEKFTLDSFFERFYNNVLAKQELFFSHAMEWVEVIFSYGEYDEVLNLLDNLFSGKIEVIDFNNISSGIIAHFNEFGVYIEQTIAQFGEFFVSLNLNLAIDFDNIFGDFPPPSGDGFVFIAAEEAGVLYAMLMIMIAGLLGLLAA